MVAQLRAKPGAAAIGVTIGDFATTVVHGTFRLAYLVFNTIGNLTSQDDQVACFANVGRHLEPGGVSSSKSRCLRSGGCRRGRRRWPSTSRRTGWASTPSTWPSSCGVSHHYWVGEGRAETFSMPYRYVWPAELDLMARIAGMRLRERWSGWSREPFTSESASHVSVWEKLGRLRSGYKEQRPLTPELVTEPS